MEIPPISPSSPPPVIAPPPLPPKRRGWMIFAIILLVLLAFSLFGNLAQFVGNMLSFHNGFHTEAFASARDAGPKLDEFTLENNKSVNKIAVITVDGIITSHEFDGSGNNMVDVIQAQLDRARDDKRVKAVILKVDSPGGEVLASDEICKAIREFQSDEADDHGKPGRKGKPVICSMGSLAASGGYYISSGTRWIVANKLTITGSIGVIMHGWNYRGLMDKVGVRPETFKSGKYKDMLSGSREPDSITSEERDMVQGLINETYGKFTNVVAKGRGRAHDKNQESGRALNPDWAEYADGRILSGTEAYKLGFVDELGTFDDAVKRAKSIAGVGKANLVEYQQRFDLSDLFRLFGQTESKVVKVDLGLEGPKLQAGRLYFLSPTFLH